MHKKSVKVRNERKSASGNEIPQGFVSLSALAGKYGYTQDHIAWLARTGRIDARQVGNRRQWYARESSLKKYREGIETAVAHGFIPLRVAARQYGYAKDYVGSLARTGKIDAQQDAGGRWFVRESSLKTYHGESALRRSSGVQPPPIASVASFSVPPVPPVAILSSDPVWSAVVRFNRGRALAYIFGVILLFSVFMFRHEAVNFALDIMRSFGSTGDQFAIQSPTATPSISIAPSVQPTQTPIETPTEATPAPAISTTPTPQYVIVSAPSRLQLQQAVRDFFAQGLSPELASQLQGPTGVPGPVGPQGIPGTGGGGPGTYFGAPYISTNNLTVSGPTTLASLTATDASFSTVTVGGFSSLTTASVSANFEVAGTASAAQIFGAGLANCTGKLLWADGTFTCGVDQAGGGGGGSAIGLREGFAGGFTNKTSTSFDAGGFNVDFSNDDARVSLDYTNGPASRAMANTWTALNVFSAGASVSTNLEVSGIASVSQLYVNGSIFTPFIGTGVTSNSLDFDELVDAMTLDTNLTVASAGFATTWNGNFYHMSGNVGIGTSNVSAKLEVAGTASISGNTFLGSSASVSANLEVAGFASSSQLFGSGLTTCTGKLLWSGGLFTCGVDQTGGTGSLSAIAVREGANTFAHVTSVSFNAGAFNVSTVASESLVSLDYTNGPASRAMANTWTALNVFSAGASVSTNFEVGGILTTGAAVSTNATNGDIVLQNNSYLRSASTLNDNTFKLIGMNGSGDIEVGNAAGSAIIMQNDFRPAIDNASDMGSLAVQWRSIYLGTSLEVGATSIKATSASFAGTVSVSQNFEAVGYASSSQLFGSGLSACTGKLLWSAGLFSCGVDQTGGGGTGTLSSIAVREGSGTFSHITSISFNAGAFNISNLASESLVSLDYTNGPASRAMANTWTALNVFSAGASVSTNLEVSGIASISQLYVGGALYTPTTSGGWTNLGGTVYLTTNSDSVGIGTQNVDSKFELVGVASIQGDVYASQLIDRQGSSYFLDPAAAATSMIVASNVGIGATAAPGMRLHVVGSSDANAIIQIDNGSTNTYLGSLTGSGYVGAATNNTFTIRSNGTDRIFVAAAGNVGIGQSSPGQTLSVAGTASVSGVMFIEGVLQSGGATGAATAYNRFGTAATTHGLAAASDLLASGKLEVDGGAFFDGGASVSGVIEIGYASASQYYGAGLSICSGVGAKLLWEAGVFSCGVDNTGSGGGVLIGLREGFSSAFSNRSSLSFNDSHFALDLSNDDARLSLDWGVGGPASLSQDETVTGRWQFAAGASVTGNFEVSSQLQAAQAVVTNVFTGNASVSGTLESATVKATTLTNSTGTLTIAAHTLSGAITGASQNITGLNQLTFTLGSASGAFEAATVKATTIGGDGVLTLSPTTRLAISTNASLSQNLEIAGTASSSLLYGAGLANCTGKLLWSDGLFTCGVDQTSGGGGSAIEVGEDNANSGTYVASASFRGTAFNVNIGSGYLDLNLDYTNGPASRAMANTWTALNVFSAGASVSGSLEVPGIASISSGGITLARGKEMYFGTTKPAAHVDTTNYPGIWVGNSNSSFMGETTTGYKGLLLLANYARTAGTGWAQIDTSKPSWAQTLSYEQDNFSIYRTPAGTDPDNGKSMFRVDTNGISLSPVDAYPLMNILPYTHDNVAVNFDAYFDGVSWRSSDAGSNFSIYKGAFAADTLALAYESGVAQGGVVTWTAGMIMDTNGNIGVGIDTTPDYALQVQRTGGDATTNYAALGVKTTAATGYGPALYLNGTSMTGGRNFALYSGGTSDVGGAGKFGIYDVTANLPRLTIDANGNVGIGDDTPTTKLDIAGSASVSSDFEIGTNLFRFTSNGASWSKAFETTSYASASSTFGSGLTTCSDGATAKLLWNSTTGTFSCGTDQTGGGVGGGMGSIGVREGAGMFVHVTSISFDGGAFDISNIASESIVKLDYTNGPASRAMANTWTALNVFSAGASVSTNLEVAGTASASATYGSGLTTCSGALSKLLWNSTTGKFSCGTDQTGGGVGTNGFKVLDRNFDTAAVSNTAAETTIYSYAIPADTLGANGTVRLYLGGSVVKNVSGGSFTVRVKLGATTVASAIVTSGNNLSASREGGFYVVLANTGTTNAQKAYIDGSFTQSANNSGYEMTVNGYGTASVDTTQAQTLTVTIQPSAANASLAWTGEMATLEFTDNSGAATFSGTGAAGQVTFWTDTASISGDNNFFWSNTTKSLGIRTNAPTAALEVQGTASASYLLSSGALQVAGFASVSYSRFGTAATVHGLAAASDLLISGMLEVQGDAWLGNASASGNFEVIGVASVSQLYVGGTLMTGQGTVASNSLNFDEFADAMTLDADTTISNNGFAITFTNASVSADLEVGGVLYANAFGGAGLADCDAAGSKLTWDVTTGQFGCGTDLNSGASPVGSNSLNFDEFANTMTLDAATTVNFGALAYTMNLNSTGDFIIADNGTAFTTFTDAGLVGIGPTAPTNKLTVSGSGTAAGTIARILVTSTDNQAGIAFTSDNTNPVIVYSPDTSDDLRIYFNSGGDKFAFTQPGNLGIGTTAPSQALHVVGGAYITTDVIAGGMLQVNGTALTTYNRVGAGVTTNALGTANDLFISGGLEVDGTIYSDGDFIADTVTVGTITGAGLSDCDTGSSKLLYDLDTRTFGCAADAATGIGVYLDEIVVQSSASMFNLSSAHFTATAVGLNQANIGLNWGAGGPASLSQDETVNGFWTFANSASITGSLETVGYASASQFYGAGLTACADGVNDKLLWDAVTGTFSCGTDTGSGKIVSSNSVDFDELVDAMTLDADTTVSNNGFALTIENASISGSFEIVGSLQAGNASLASLAVSGGASLSANADISGNLDVTGQLFTTSASASGSIEIVGYASASRYFGANLMTCNGANDKLAYDAVTGTFSCGTDNQTAGRPASDSLDFDELANSLTLDANTVIASNGFTLTLQTASVSGDLFAKRFFGAGLPDCDQETQTLLYDANFGTFFCGSDDQGVSAAGGWTDDGAIVRLSAATDNVAIGTNTAAGKLRIVGDAGGAAANAMLVVASATGDANLVVGPKGNLSVGVNANNYVYTLGILDRFSQFNNDPNVNNPTNTSILDSPEDVYIHGGLEVDDKVFFDNTASMSSNLELGADSAVNTTTPGHLYIHSYYNGSTPLTAAPNIANNADRDTGIWWDNYNNGDGDLYFTTNGTTTLWLDSSKNIGIGSVTTLQTAPAAKLEITGDAGPNPLLLISSSSGKPMLVVGQSANLVVGYNNSNIYNYQYGILDKFSQFNNDANANNPTNTSILDSPEDVYIHGGLEVDDKVFFDNTASMASNLELGGNGATDNNSPGHLYIHSYYNGSTPLTAAPNIANNADRDTGIWWDNYNNGDGDLYFTTNGTTTLWLDSSKNIGIGSVTTLQTAPAAKLEITGDAGANSLLLLASASNKAMLVVGKAGNLTVGYNNSNTYVATYGPAPRYAGRYYSQFNNDPYTNAINDVNFTSPEDLYVNGNFRVGSKAFFDSNASVSGNFEVTGYIYAKSTLAVPQYSFSGDTNTGLYYTAADTFHVVTAGTQRMTFAAGGNVGIGDTTPDQVFDVAGEIQLDLTGTQAANALCHPNNGQTSNQNIVDCTGTLVSDYMELYPMTNEVQEGEIVVPSSTSFVLDNENNKVARLIRSTRPYQSGILGITSIASQAGDFNSIGYNIDQAHNPKPLALSGRVLLKVSTQNGPIKVGDRITSSDIPGVGMKATAPGMTVGTALEALPFTSGPYQKIMVFVQAQYWAPELTADQPIATSSWQSSTFDSLFASITAAFKSLLNITFQNGLIQTVKGMFDTVEVKKGVTTFDEDTGLPYCIKMKSGQLVSVPGECGVDSSATPAPTGAGAGSSSPTPTPSQSVAPTASGSSEFTPTPTPSPNPTSSPAPAPDAAVTVSPTPESTPTPSAEPTPAQTPESTPPPVAEASPAV